MIRSLAPGASVVRLDGVDEFAGKLEAVLVDAKGHDSGFGLAGSSWNSLVRFLAGWGELLTAQA